ncbi:Fic family protein [Candidatus Woesearchaeota archaeon]|nr:Fic family protein [Candidatus Woesearchaeota archaeon]
MAFVSSKVIKGKKQYYLEESVRRVDGSHKKISMYLKDYHPDKPYKKLGDYKSKLARRVLEKVISFAADYYVNTLVFNKEQLKKIEAMRLGYKAITRKLTPKQWQDIIDRFTVNFTYESNAIEGNSLTLKDVTLILHEKKVVKGKDLREIYETINTREAMELIFKRKLKVKEEDIIELHTMLTKHTGVSPGYKQLPNFLLGRNVETTPPERVEGEMKKLITDYHRNERMHPLERASLFHGAFEKIHPFEDGNGRVGRLLINIILMENGYPPLIIRKTQRVAYFSALDASDHGYQDKLKRFLLDKFKDTYQKFFEVYVKYLD